MSSQSYARNRLALSAIVDVRPPSERMAHWAVNYGRPDSIRPQQDEIGHIRTN